MARLASHHAAAHDAARALDGNAALGALHQNNEGHNGDHADQHHEDDQKAHRAPGVGLDLGDQIAYAAGKAGHDARKDQQTHAVADAAVGNLLAQPHNERGAAGQRQNCEEHEADARIQHQSLRVRMAAMPMGLQRAQNHSDVARPLRNLAPAQLAFLLNARQRLIDHRQQLKDDRGRDVGHDAQGEDGHAAQVAPAEQVHQPQRRTALRAEEQLQLWC